MPQDELTKRLKGAALAGIFGALLVAGALGPARAEDDDEWIDQKFFRGILTGLGLKRGDVGNNEIEYRERSPLVVPPSRDLPPPETTSTVEANPAWPVDQDVTRRKQAAEKRKRGGGDAVSNWEESQRVLRPGELNVPGPVDKSGQHGTSTDPELASNPLRPSELGYKGNLFSFGSLFGGSKEEQARFEKEPARTTLTEPPAGYRTPAPTQPYGLGVKSVTPAKPMTPADLPSSGTQ